MSAHRLPSGRVLFVLILSAGYFVLEVVGGLLTNSLALLADAGHMLTDVAALLISFLAFKIAQRPPSKKASYGYYRAEVLAALFNGLILLVVAFFIVKEAILRLLASDHEIVATKVMILIGFGGLIINIIGLKILHHDKNENINIKSAWLHILFDALGSFVVVIAGLFIYFGKLNTADSIGSLIIAILVFYSSMKLIGETIAVLMEQTPSHIDSDQVIQAIKGLDGVSNVHDLHIWSITPGKDALSAHVVIEQSVDHDSLQAEVHGLLLKNFGIEHVTIQMERSCTRPDKACEQL